MSPTILRLTKLTSMRFIPLTLCLLLSFGIFVGHYLLFGQITEGFMHSTGLEPVRPRWPQGSQPCVSTNSTTNASCTARVVVTSARRLLKSTGRIQPEQLALSSLDGGTSRVRHLTDRAEYPVRESNPQSRRATGSKPVAYANSANGA